MRWDLFSPRGEGGFSIMEKLAAFVAPGRPKTRSHGGFVAGDLTELKKAIILCPSCQHKYDARRHHYYSVWRYEQTIVIGDCDACRAHTDVGRLFLHEASVPRAWLTKNEDRRRRQHAVPM